MFENIPTKDQLMQYERVTRKAKKIGRLYGGITAVLVALIGIVILFSGNATVGAFVGIAAIVIIDYFICYQMGKCYPWCYYWLITKLEAPIALILTLFLGFYIGLALRIKYHGLGKKIQATL